MIYQHSGQLVFQNRHSTVSKGPPPPPLPLLPLTPLSYTLYCSSDSVGILSVFGLVWFWHFVEDDPCYLSRDQAIRQRSMASHIESLCTNISNGNSRGGMI